MSTTVGKTQTSLLGNISVLSSESQSREDSALRDEL